MLVGPGRFGPFLARPEQNAGYHYTVDRYTDFRYMVLVIRSIKDKASRDIFDGLNSKPARKLPAALHNKARRLLDLLNGAAQLEDLRVPPGNRLEALSGDLKGFHSIRINDQWRIIFRWQEGNVSDVQIVDYH